MKRVTSLLISISLIVGLGVPANAVASVKYLDLKAGCYAGTPTASKPLKWSAPGYKTLYSKSCNSAHHYEVFYVGKLTTNLKDDQASQDQANTKCGSAADAYLSGANFSNLLTVGWFFPDPGAEEKKYGKKLICFFRYASESTWDYSQVSYKPALQSA
jgi:hypothetical protein